MLHYYIWTIGCQMNKAESEKLIGYLEHLGYQSSSVPQEADLILLNSCVVRESAESRVVNKLHSLKSLKKANPRLQIALTGCIVGPDYSTLQKTFPFIDHFFKPGEIPDWLGQPSSENTLSVRTGATDYIPIMQGCNNFCSYCIVPYRRGRERSRPLAEIVSEIKVLAGRGIREVTLLGQNVDSYGHDLADGTDLANLLAALNPLEGLWRIRFLTNHPKDMQPKLIEAIASLDKVCEQINLPVQAGSDAVLTAMRRGYSAQHYRRLIDQIREKVPDISLSTDIIVGFPGETDAQFEETFSLLSDIKFDLVHVAAYSPRAGTLAAREMLDDVPAETKKLRLSRVEKLQADIAREINAGFQDQVVEVLVEGQKKGKWSGRTRGDKLVFFSSSENCLGRLINVHITHTSPWSLTGEKL
jgi:tRNA-2-methylthio-N6-dimethylallyladenosine synthase